MYAIGLVILTFGPMALEAWHSSRNERTLRALGAREPAGDVFRAMQMVYPGCFLAMIGEAWLRRRGFGAIALWGSILFAGSKALKYWAITSLGPRWTFHVLVPPGSHRTTSGPYRLLRHPNYVAVVGELVGMALLAQAPLSGVLAVVVFSALLVARVRVEERALG